MKDARRVSYACNTQTMVSPRHSVEANGNGMLITAADVTNAASDHAQLTPMVEQVPRRRPRRDPHHSGGRRIPYGANLKVGNDHVDTLMMPERRHAEVRGPYFKDRFIHDADTDTMDTL